MLGIPENKKIDYAVVKLSIAVNGTTDYKEGDIPDGEVIGVKFVPYDASTTRNHGIAISIKDGSATDILPTTDYRDFVVSGSGYINGFKPTSFRYRTPRCTVTSEQQITESAFSGELVFVILKDK